MRHQRKKETHYQFSIKTLLSKKIEQYAEATPDNIKSLVYCMNAFQDELIKVDKSGTLFIWVPMVSSEALTLLSLPLVLAFPPHPLCTYIPLFARSATMNTLLPHGPAWDPFLFSTKSPILVCACPLT